ncbi:alpha/beta hydrolase [Bradyrhizobium sp. LHD-71]|uniref:alpha/beta fold hydrolase n=1 Tax=Bradyrhizobium sp. LHD-71 TaxID=3072141 RepID=UPI0028105C59|nr:alpha/beta hydrolase [Bradyrhizobium sp. LHD-71]MDQ8732348.1 alpha/beta hydrolase [Bradyrhizobium sp. LHD-71]
MTSSVEPGSVEPNSAEPSSAVPKARFYESQGLRLHYADWGNATAPPLVLLHGGRDHCRSWDWIARALQPHFHVMAADLRGHGDSDWAKGSSYSLSDHVYDLTRMVSACDIDRMTLIGHSYGGMIAMAYAGTYPDKVSRLAIVDGAFLPRPPAAAIDQQMQRWIGDLDKLSASKARRYRTVEEAAERMSAKNKRLTSEQAHHLARYAVRENADGSFSWKYDPIQRVSAPYRLSGDDYVALWSRITCPTLFLCGSESFVPDPKRAGIFPHFKQAEQQIIAGAAHWVQHDKLDEVLAALRSFLGISR